MTNISPPKKPVIEPQTVESWLTINDPKHVRHARVESPTVLSFLASAESFHGISKPVVSGAKIIGNNKDNSMDRNDAVKNAMPGDTEMTQEEYNNLLDKFKGAPMTGCTTVMDMARVTSGFNPQIPLKEGNYTSYLDYVKRIASAPFFHLEYSNTIEYHRESKDWNDAIDEIVGLYDGIKAEDENKIKESLVNLAKAATSRSDTKQKENLFVQNSLEASMQYRVHIYYSNVELVEHKSKGSTSKQTDFTIARTRLRFYDELWEHYAERVMKKHVKLMDDWLDDNTTKAGDQSINLCI